MRTSLVLCFCLLTWCGITPVLYGFKVVVEEDSDAVLPCLINTKEDITGEIFFWKKDGQKEVFFYDNGIHSNNGFTGQDEQFKGRVSHFQDQLQNGNASIKIQNTKMADSGNYSCIFPRHQRQTFYIQLVVERLLRDRSGEIPGASKPIITILDQTQDWKLLQCEVQGASPEPKVEWQDSSGNILPAEEPQVSEKGGRYNVILKTTVTKTDHYRCEVTQEEISHHTSAEMVVFISEKPDIIGWLGGIVIGAVLLFAVQALLVATKRITVGFNKDCHQGKECLCNDPKRPGCHLGKCCFCNDSNLSYEQLQSAAEGQSSDVTDSKEGQQQRPSQNYYVMAGERQQQRRTSQESHLYENLRERQQQRRPSQDSHLYENLPCHVHPPDDPNKSVTSDPGDENEPRPSH